MNDSNGYAVFFFPPALEVLGEAIKPYLQDGPAGPHVPCREVDTGGAFVEMTLQGRTEDGRDVSLELMVPGNMVRMIVSARSDDSFGFYDRNRPLVVILEPAMTAIPAHEPDPATRVPKGDTAIAPPVAEDALAAKAIERPDDAKPAG